MTDRQRRAFSKQFHRDKRGSEDLSYEELVDWMRAFKRETGRGGH